MRIRSRPSHATVVAYLALFVALGGTTYAATGQNFILGQSNSAGNTTSLTAPVAGKGLQVTNNSTGTGATALGLNVASGRAPFTVNSGTKVANLNADKLDGIDSTGLVLKAAEAWHEVAAPSGSTTCSNTDAVFCTFPTDLGLTPWKNFGGGNATAAFYKDQLGIVHLKGLVVPPDESNPKTTPERRNIFRLPAAYRPQSTRVFPSVGQSTFGQEVAQGRVDVQPDGYVVLEKDCVTTADGPCSADVGYLTLDGITFRPTG